MKRAMIVDDSKFMRNILKGILLRNGFEIAGEAENGLEAVHLYSQTRPDFVTMDITMSEMDGIEALKEIRKIDRHANVIMCSAMGQKSMIIESINAGAKDFIIKPFNEEGVKKVLMKVLN